MTSGLGNLSAQQLCENEKIDSGDTAWVLTSTALVLFMTLPGVMLFYGGLTNVVNRISALAQTLAISSIVSILWIMIGYSLSFSEGNSFIGGSGRFWLIGERDSGNQKSGFRLGPNTRHILNCKIPEPAFAMFQAGFAVISAALIYGSVAERMKFAAILPFIALHHLLVYCVVAHWEWAPGGFLNQLGTLDYAGGDVVHITAGVSGLVAAWFVGPRSCRRSGTFNNASNTLSGACMLWIGWFGFNGGSAGSANGRASMALMMTHISAAMGALTWMSLDWMQSRLPSLIDMASGAVAGLVVITPGCGYVDQTGAFCMGLLGSAACYYAMLAFKTLPALRQLDDAMDVFVIHGVGGAVGGFLTGLFANDFVTESATARGAFYGRPEQLGYQLVGIVVTVAWSAAVTALLLKLVDYTLRRLPGYPNGLRATDEELESGLDASEHGDFEDASWPLPKPAGLVAESLVFSNSPA